MQKIIICFLAICIIKINCSSLQSSATIQLKKAEVTVQLQFDISINDQDSGSFVIGLFGKDVPKAVENFQGICTGNNSYNLSYRGSQFYRIEEDLQIFAGDVTKNDGKGGFSIFGEDFDREEQLVMHNSYAVGMVILKSKVRSQFYITTQDNDYYPNNGLVIGRVINGKKLIRKISQFGQLGKPTRKVVITNCSIIELDNKKEDL